MGFSSNGMGSIRNNRNLQRSTKRHFREVGRSTLPTGFHNEEDKSPSYAMLRERMNKREIYLFLVLGTVSIALGLFLTMWFL